MAGIHITGAGTVNESDVKAIRWVGKTKAGKAVEITLKKAICLSNPDWTFAEKDDTVPELEFTALYDDEKLATGDRTEPWELKTTEDITPGNDEIILGVGKFYMAEDAESLKSDKTCYLGLTRGGGSFVVERTYRPIAADDDPGMVEGRIDQTDGQPKLKLKLLQWFSKAPKIYAGMKNIEGT